MKFQLIVSAGIGNPYISEPTTISDAFDMLQDIENNLLTIGAQRSIYYHNVWEFPNRSWTIIYIAPSLT